MAAVNEGGRASDAEGSWAGARGQHEAFQAAFWVFIMSPVHSTEGV